MVKVMCGNVKKCSGKKSHEKCCGKPTRSGWIWNQKYREMWKVRTKLKNSPPTRKVGMYR
jgi:hypothetical protein